MRELFNKLSEEGGTVTAITLVTIILSVVSIMLFVIFTLVNGTLAVWNWGAVSILFWSLLQIIMLILWGAFSILGVAKTLEEIGDL